MAKLKPAYVEKSDVVAYAKSAGLRYVTDSKAGYSRKRKGKSFAFYDMQGKQIKDEAEIQRIKSLAIPPAYKDVWISPFANGHLQATGIDARGRKQYRYHAEWRNVRDAAKFYHLLDFGNALPEIRRRTTSHMAKTGLPREKVMATVVALLEKTLIRVGNDEYAKSNKSYGLTTLRDKHVDITGQTMRFNFKGKSGKEWNLKLSDRRIANVLKKCEEIEGQELLKYLDENGEPRDVTSSDVNTYLKEVTGEDFTAKDYRTWSGTVLAAMALQEYMEYSSQTEAKRNMLAAIDKVAKKLGNTRSICRKCYIHPEVFNAYLDGSLAKQITTEINKQLKKKYESLSDEEILVLMFLQKRLKQ